MVGKVFEKLINNRPVDYLEKCGLFSDSRYGFMSSQSTADCLTALSNRVARIFNSSGDTLATAHDLTCWFSSQT